jgi:hypothetical protein
VAGLPSAEPVDGLPRPLGEQLTDVVRAALTTQVIAGDMTPTPDWVEAAARNIATVLLAEFDIDRRRIR